MKTTYFLFLFVFFSFSAFSMVNSLEKERQDTPVQNNFTFDKGKRSKKAKRTRKKRKRKCKQFGRKVYAG